MIVPQTSAAVIVSGSSGNYEARYSSGTLIASGSSASTVITAGVNALSSGQTMALIGEFVISSQITISKASIALNFSQASVTVTTGGTTIPFRVTASSITFYGGHEIQNTSPDPLNPAYTITTDPSNNGGHITGSGNPYYAFQTASSYTTFDGFDISGFGSSGSAGGCVVASSGSSYMTIKNCYLHNMASREYVTAINVLGGSGYHNVSHNIIDVSFTGFLSAGSGHNTIEYNEFKNWHVSLLGHAIYIDGSAGNDGYNEVANNYFHDGTSGNAIYFKTVYNKAHDNLIKNLNTGNAPGIQLFGELGSYTASYNEIYNNRIESCVLGLWIRTGSGRADGNLVYGNTFYNVQNMIQLSSGSLQTNKIYYNDFYNVSGRHPFPAQSGGGSIQNTVVAYNYFDAVVPSADVSWLQSCSNTMIYQNTFFPPNTNVTMSNYNYASVIDPTSLYYVAPRA